LRVRDPGLNFANLNDKDTLAAFSAVIANHYRYYQYYANTLIAVIGAFFVYLGSHNWCASWKLWVSFAVTALVLFFGSRDALKKYYARAEQILGRAP
jgi:hypothetical protein